MQTKACQYDIAQLAGECDEINRVLSL